MTVIQHRRGTTAEWAASSYILEAGEIGIEIDTSTNPDTVIGAKIGNGESLWSALDYVGSGGLPVGGTAGQIVAKIDSTDYNAEWIDNYTTDVRHTVINNTGSTLYKGQAVYISNAGNSSDTPRVALAQANAEATSSKTLGLLMQDLAQGASGFVIASGLLTGIDTSAASAGDAVWLSYDTAGGRVYVNPPSKATVGGPVHVVYLGVVGKSNASQGSIIVKIQNGYELDEIHDAYINGKTDKDLLAYESSTGLWKNKSFSTLGLVSTSSLATSTTPGIVELFSDTVQTVAANTVTATALKTYGIQVNGSGQLVVNVPWTGTVTSASVVPANGFAGTVATASTTPAITLKTTVDGLLKGTSSTGVVSAATAGTDYLAPPSGTALLKANSGGALANAVAGTDYLAPPSGTALLKANSGGALANAVAGTDYQAAITANGILKGAGAGSVSAAVAGTDYLVPSGSANISTSGTITSTATTASTSTTTGAIVSSGGIGVAGNAYVGGNLTLSGNLTVNGTTTTVGTDNLVVQDPLIYMGEGNNANSVDLGFIASFNNGTYQHSGLVRDSDDGIWKLFSNVVPEPTTVVDFTSASYDTLKIGALQVTDATTTRSNLGLVIGTNVQAYSSTLAGITGTKVTNWDTAYGWGNHSSAGYLTTSTASTTYLPITPIEIPNAADLDTYTTSGTYVQSSNAEAAAGTNYPAALAGTLRVVANSNTSEVWQTYHTLGGASTNKVYQRGFYVTWSPWKEVVTTDGTTFTGAVALNGGFSVDSTAFSVADSTGNTSIAGTLAVGGHVSVSSGKQSAIATSQTSTTVVNTWGANKVVMTAGVASALAPTLRPDGTALQAGDVWISW